MFIAHIFSILLLSFGAAALYLGISATRKQFREYLGNSILGALCFCSAIWSYGFGILFLTDNVKVAYWGRTLGMIGVFGFLILVQILVGVIIKIPQKIYKGFCIFSMLGVLIYFPVVSPHQTNYYLGDWGMTYTFRPGLIGNIYTVYSVVYAVNLAISIYYMIKAANNKRGKVTSYRILVTFIIVFFGMVLDTILPMFGFGAIPGSSITQFIGLLVLYYAIVDHNKTRIIDRNMSQYVYSSISEPVVVLNSEGILTLMNQAARKMLDKVLKVTGEYKVSIFEVFDLEKKHLFYEEEHRTDDSYTVVDRIPVQIQTSKIRDKYGDLIGYILTIKDMTQITMVMNSLVEAKQEAEANNLAKSAFLANMSHEIRTPLNAIVGFSELLLKSDISDKDKEQIEDIRNSSHNLLAIINDILDISKIESNKMELNETEYEIRNVIRDAYLITDTISAKKGLTFTMDIDENIPSKLYGDPVRIRGILVNILNNSVKYTREGSVSLKGELKAVESGNAILKFYIKDTGIGIKEEDIPKLFESFKQVDTKKNSGIEGTGLGLAIVKGFLNLMHGDVCVESTYGEGTTFIITIPQKIVDATPIGKMSVKENKSKAKSSIGNVKFTGARILAVDDNKVNLKVISKVLEKYEIEVTTATSGEEAINSCRNEKYDLVMMDQMMPVMDGVEAMNEIRKLSDYYSSDGECTIIALTANAISGVKEELIGLGFDDYLSKPIDFVKLEELLKKYVDSKMH